MSAAVEIFFGWRGGGNPSLNEKTYTHPPQEWKPHPALGLLTLSTCVHDLYVSFKLASLYCGLRLILVYPNP